MSKKSIVTFGVLGLVAAGLTGMLYMNNARLNVERIRERVKAIAATGAPLFDPDDLRALRTEDSVFLPEYEKVVTTLEQIQKENEGITYVYILRPTVENNMYEFVADSYGLHLDNPPDTNNDGVIGVEDEIPIPGMPYDVSEIPSVVAGMQEPVATEEPLVDQWGTFISGFAPIRDEEGNAVAVLGVDKWAEDVQVMTLGSFKPLWIFLGLFMLFVAIRLAAFHKSLLNEMLKLSRMKKVLITSAVCAVVAVVITIWIYQIIASVNTERIRDQVKAIAATAATEFTVQDLEQLHGESDIVKPEWEKVVMQLQSVRERNQELRYVYILRPTNNLDVFEFVSDADSLDPYAKIDLNNDGIIDDADALNPPGYPYDVSEIPGVQQGMIEPSADEEPLTDQWGTFISGFAPIKDVNGKTVAVLGVDRIASDVHEMTFGTFNPVQYFVVIFLFFVVFRLVVFHSPLLRGIIKLSRQKRVLASLAGCSLIALVVTAGMYKYTLELMKDEIGMRLMSIAATAAPEIDAKDLVPLRFARDMERPEYQRVYEKLNKIRERNENIEYVYLMRPTHIGSSIWEFIADADTTIELLEEQDSSPTGLQYELLPFSPEMYLFGLQRPTYEQDFIYDQWGVHLSGSAPIFNSQGDAIAIIGIDMEVSDVYDLINRKFKTYIWFIALLGLTLLMRIFLLWNKPDSGLK